jgi:hypothetical protein
MIRIDSATRKLQAVLAGAVTTNELPVIVSYEDELVMPAGGPTLFDGSTKISTTAGAAAVDICVPPANNAQNIVRTIDSISIHNADTVSATVTVRYNDNGTLSNLLAMVLSAGDTLIYSANGAWTCLDANGNLKKTG